MPPWRATRVWSALLLLGVLLVALAGCGRDDDAPVLGEWAGSHRVIAAFTDDGDRATAVANAFKSAPDLDERDIAWFVVGPTAILSNQDHVPDRERLERLHTVAAFQVVLIGKDGTLRASQLGGLDIQALLDALKPTQMTPPGRPSS